MGLCDPTTASDAMSLKQELDCLFDPGSIAVIGASNTFGKWGFNTLGRLLGTQGNRRIYAINRKEDEVLGLKAYDTVLETPEAVDLAVVTVPHQYLMETMQQCGEKGVKVAVVISSGLAETGADGARIERDVVRVARRAGVRIVGPNCLGHFDTHSGVCTVPFLPPVRKGEAALISQSGNSSQSVFNHGLEMGLGFSKFVSSGNEADLHFEDYLEYLAEDDRTKIIIGYVEGFRDGRRFVELARSTTKRKPIVVMKAGRTDVGARAARSHTAALAGTDIVLDAALEQSGVIRVEELSELVDVAVPLIGQPLPRGRRVGVLAMGGGMAVMAADALRREGFELPPLSQRTMDALNAMLSDRWSHGNPVDPAGDFVSYHLLWPMIEDENFDAIVMIGGVGMTSSFAGWAGLPPSIEFDVKSLRRNIENAEMGTLERTIEMIRKHGKPVLFTTMVWGAARKGKVYGRMKREHMFSYATPDAAARALRHLADYSEYIGVAS